MELYIRVDSPQKLLQKKINKTKQNKTRLLFLFLVIFSYFLIQRQAKPKSQTIFCFIFSYF